MRLFLLLGCCLFLLGSVAPEAMVGSNNFPVRAGKDYALFFAVDDYSVNARFDDLPNPIESANNIADELREMFAFRARVVPDPSRQMIYAELRDYQNKTFGPDDQLFLFFSGHGDFDEFEKKGYFVPRTGDQIDLTTLGNIITQIPCRHILVVIDACYSGTIDQEIAFQGDFVPRRPGQTSASERDVLISNQLRNKSRLLLTSGTKVRTPSSAGGSPFAKAILAALRQSYTIGDGLVLYKDLEAKLERVRPKPHYGVLRGHEDGSFVFVANTVVELSISSPTRIDKSALTASADENMAFIPGGSFKVKDYFKGEYSTRTVVLSDYYIGRTEITNQEYADFLNGMGNQKQGGSQWYEIDSKFAVIVKKGNEFVPKQGFEDHPVYEVSWYGAIAYCNWLSDRDGLSSVYHFNGNRIIPNWSANGYRLPTEAEWEYAARSGGKEDVWAGTSIVTTVRKFANFKGSEDGYLKTAPVGSFKGNSFGLMDMSGNVWEWCWDLYHGGRYGQLSELNPRGVETGYERICRGGSWNGHSAMNPLSTGLASSPTRQLYDVGFRLARNSR